MKEKTIYIARKIENGEFCPILIYRDGNLLVEPTPLENKIFRVKLNFVEEFDQVDNDENDLETILKSRTKTQDSISILVYFENGVAKELITGRTITYIKQKTEKIDAGRKIIEQNVVPGESGSVFFEISDDYPLYIPHDEDIEKYKAPASLGNMNLDLTYIFSLGKEKIKKPLGGKQKKIGDYHENNR